MSELRDAIRKLAGTDLVDRVSIVVCTVDSVDITDKTCNCTPIGGDATTRIPGVKLNAEQNDGFIIIPSVDSTVIVAYSDRNLPFVLMYSEISEVYFVQNIFRFNDGAFGGLTKTAELKAQLDKTNDVLQAIVDALSNWTVVPGDGGAALKTAFASLIAGKVKGNYTNIENTKITHG